MGIQYSAVLIVGLPREHLLDANIDEDVLDDLDSAPPYFDGEEDAIVGVYVERSGDYQAKEIALDQAKVDAAKAKFHELTGHDGKLYLSPRGF